MHLTLFFLRMGEMLIIDLDIWSSVLPIIIINHGLWEKSKMNISMPVTPPPLSLSQFGLIIFKL